MVYDIAAGLKTPSQLKALVLANEQQRQNTRITKQSADYYEKSGRSEASQKQEELQIKKDENTIQMGNMEARWAELERGLDEDARQAFKDFRGSVTAVQRYRQITGDEQGAAALYDTLVKGYNAGEDFEATGMAKYNPKVVEALATESQINDPLKPQAWLNLSTGKNMTLMPDDLKGIQKAMAEGFVPWTATAQFGKNDIQGDPALQRQLVNQELAYDEALGTIADIKGVLDKSSNPGGALGTVNSFVRVLESIGSQLTALPPIIAGINPNQTEVAETADGEVETDINPVTNPGLYEEFLNNMEKGNFHDAVVEGAATQANLKNLAYSMAKLLGTDNDRLSDTDVKHWMSILNTGSVTQLRTVMAQMERQITRRRDVARRLLDPQGKVASVVDSTNPRKAQPTPQEQAQTTAPPPTAPRQERSFSIPLTGGGNARIRLR